MEQTAGYRLSGVDTKYIKNKEELKKEIENVKKDSNIGIVLIGKDIQELGKKEFDEMKKSSIPLLLQI